MVNDYSTSLALEARLQLFNLIQREKHNSMDLVLQLFTVKYSAYKHFVNHTCIVHIILSVLTHCHNYVTIIV